MSDQIEVSGSVFAEGLDSELSGISSSVTNLSVHFHQIVLILVCILIYSVGWRKVFPGLILYVLYDFARNQCIDESEDFIYLMVIFSLLRALDWCRKTLAKKMMKKSTEPFEN